MNISIPKIKQKIVRQNKLNNSRNDSDRFTLQSNNTLYYENYEIGDISKPESLRNTNIKYDLDFDVQNITTKLNDEFYYKLELKDDKLVISNISTPVFELTEIEKYTPLTKSILEDKIIFVDSELSTLYSVEPKYSVLYIALITGVISFLFLSISNDPYISLYIGWGVAFIVIMFLLKLLPVFASKKYVYRMKQIPF